MIVSTKLQRRNDFSKLKDIKFWEPISEEGLVIGALETIASHIGVRLT